MGSILREYKGHHETVHACLFIPYCVGQAAGNLIVSSASDCTVRIWHRETCGEKPDQHFTLGIK